MLIFNRGSLDHRDRRLGATEVHTSKAGDSLNSRSVRRCSDGYKRHPSRCIGTLSEFFLTDLGIIAGLIHMVMLVMMHVKDEATAHAYKKHTETQVRDGFHYRMKPLVMSNLLT